MIALVVTMKVEAQNQPEFEAAIGDLTRSTRENEPGVQLYQLCKSHDDSTCYRLLEIYESQDALTSHLASDWFKAAGPKLGSFFAERPSIVHHDTIG